LRNAARRDVDLTRPSGCDSRSGRSIERRAGLRRPCFPRDNLAFSAWRGPTVCRHFGRGDAQLNQSRRRVGQVDSRAVAEGGTVGVMGLSYKPNTEVIEESQGLALASTCCRLACGGGLRSGRHGECRPQLAGNVTFAASAADCARQADVLGSRRMGEFREISRRNSSRTAPCWTAGGC